MSPRQPAAANVCIKSEENDEDDGADADEDDDFLSLLFEVRFKSLRSHLLRRKDKLLPAEYTSHDAESSNQGSLCSYRKCSCD